MRHFFIYNGKSTRDFGIRISGEDTWKKPAPDIERTSIPGRNGDLIASNRRYSNVDIVYPAGIVRDFDSNFTAFANFMLSSPGYHMLEDSYHPDVYRLAVMESDFDPEMTKYNREGQFEIKFNCKPQTFLKSGNQELTFTEATTIFNPTLYEAKPLIRVYGTGNVEIGDEILTILSTDSYTDVDCENEEAYMDNSESPRNDKVEVSGDSFPTFPPGETYIRLGGGITKIVVKPRWWKL